MIYIFFVSHWLLCVFFQSFFLHRYAAHSMFKMGPRTERFMHLMTYLVQGSSFLSPRAYAILHRQHHAYSDTKEDPHSPLFHQNALKMMWKTKHRYDDYAYFREEPAARFLGGYPEWPLIDRKLGQSWAMRLTWIGIYSAIYFVFATSPWQFLLLPLHFVMGPIHGAIVNWCGHKYGYRNFSLNDASKNTLPLELLTMGELFQNNHHRFSQSPNFAAKWFELDPTWQVMRALSWLKVIDLRAPNATVLSSLAERPQPSP